MKVNTNKPYFIQRKKGAEMYTYTTKNTILSPQKTNVTKYFSTIQLFGKTFQNY